MLFYIVFFIFYFLNCKNEKSAINQYTHSNNFGDCGCGDSGGCHGGGGGDGCCGPR